MEQRIVDALTGAFAQARVELDRMSNGRFSGLVVWEGFEPYDSVERQRRVREALVEQLNGEATTVGVLLVYTPRELQSMQAA